MRCAVCRNPDKRRAIELMWNGGMAALTISNVFDGNPSNSTILKHLKEHSEGEGASRAVEVRPETPVRERVLALQRLQLDEIERRIELAKARADEMNAFRDKVAAIAEEKGEPYELHHVDWSDFTDILGKEMQAAIGSILKAQGLTDKREKATADLKLGLFEAMTRGGGLAPKSLIGGVIPPQLTEGEVVEND